MDKKKVLIICRYFVPYTPTLGWGLRMLRLSKYLAANGYDVSVMAAKEKNSFGYFGYESDMKGIKCHYLKHFPNFLGRRKAVSGGDAAGVGGLKAFLEMIAAEVSIPDLFIWFVVKFYLRAKKLIETENISRVIISTPPHSLQLVGLLLKKKFGDKVKIVSDYRDSWNERGIFRKKVPLFQELNRYLEKMVVGNADHLTYVSGPIMDKIASAYGREVREKSTLITNGFDPEILAKPDAAADENTPGNPLRIGYFGSIHDRWVNPSGFVETLSKVVGAKDFTAKREPRLEFYGTCDSGLAGRIKGRLGERVVFKGPVGHREALGLMRRMDYLFLCYSETEGSDEILTGKFFDYISTGKPVMVWGPAGMEVSKIVKANGFGIVLEIGDEKRNLELLRNMIVENINFTLSYSLHDLKEFTAPFQFSKFISIL